MTPLLFVLIVFFASFGAGMLGSLLGIGGGIVVVPVLTLIFKVDIHLAIGASIVGVIATSTGAAAAYVRERMTNLRVAMLLEIATACGAMTGAILAGHIGTKWIFIIFGVMMGYSGLSMLRRKSETHGGEIVPDALADRLKLHNSFYDESTKTETIYRVRRTKLGFGLMYLAGITSGLLGIGSGVLKVPAMDLAMGLPIKVSTATSNFMMGVTAAASAVLYFARGDIVPFIAAPVAAGILLGATIGSKLLSKITNRRIRIMFVIVMLWVSVQMLWRGVTQ